MNKEPRPEIAERAENTLTDRIIRAAIEVHRHLGPGLLESVYEECLCYELNQSALEFKRQVHLPIRYKGIHLDCGHRLDLVVENTIVVEIKAVESLLLIHSAQLLTYLKSSGHQVGLLINFNVPVLKKGLKRIVSHYDGPRPSAQPSAPSALDPRAGAQPSASSALDSREDAHRDSLSSTPRLSPRLRVSAVSPMPEVK